MSFCRHSVYQYQFWRGTFYPEVQDATAGRGRPTLPTVEINYLSIDAQPEIVSAGGAGAGWFRFSIKGSRRITHYKR